MCENKSLSMLGSLCPTSLPIFDSRERVSVSYCKDGDRQYDQHWLHYPVETYG